MKQIMKIFIITIFLINSFIEKAFSQTKSEISDIKNTFIITKSKKEYNYAKNNKNEIEIVFSGLFLFYKTFISSQDMQSCTFTPSCSEYGLEAVKKQGVFIGVINTFDRLTRCNSLSPEKYTIDPKTHLLYDPVE